MQTSIFDIIYPKFKIDKKIRLITLFSGYDSQALALKYLDIDFEHYKTCEWAVKSIQALKDLHFENDTIDYSKDLSKEQLIEKLFNKGISADYNKSMTLDQIKRLSENQLRTIYNNIKATHNLVNIQQVKGSDLEIKDTNKYCYIMTYSFPCQDLSLAGNRKGMSDTSTRSGMLWEVERILTELKERPQVLIMENVVQVHGEGNVNDFNKWQLRLEELGYKNYWQDLIATDYGIPQTRNRCFMVSVLGDYNYTFPKPIPLKLKLKDMLEDQVDEKYFLSEKTINGMLNTKFHQYQLKNRLQDAGGAIDTLTTATGERCPHCVEVNPKLPIKNATKKGYREAEVGDGIDISGRMEYHRGTVQKNKSQSITCGGGNNIGVVVND
jgi:DNA (cytosine-5)-methyltransferase 1